MKHRSVIVALAAAGIAGTITFPIAALVQSLLRPEHNLVVHPISALAAGPNGWIQNVNFFVFGALMIAYAVGLHLGIRPTRRGAAGVALLVLSGMGLVWAALFPATTDTGAFQETRLSHVPGFIMTFSGAGIGLIVMSRRMAGDPRWRSIAAYALAIGIFILALLLAGGVLVRPRGALLHAWWGLFQWILLALWLPCTIIVALRLLRAARAVDAPQRPSRGMNVGQ